MRPFDCVVPGPAAGRLIAQSAGLQALQLIQAEVAKTPVDVVLYLDRLDLYRVEPVDHAVRCVKN